MNRSLLQRKKITREQVVELYHKLGSATAVAKYLQAREKTIRRYLHQAGVKMKPGSRKGVPKKKTSQLVKWCQDHPGVSLPRDRRQIVKVTGLSQKAVYNFLARLDAAFMKRLREVVFSKTTKLSDIQNRLINFSYVDVYKLRGDSKSGMVYIEVTMGKFKTVIQTKLEDLL